MTEPIFEVANCRGKKPVIRDLVKIVNKLSGLKTELNTCRGKLAITKAIELLETALILDDDGIKIYK